MTRAKFVRTDAGSCGAKCLNGFLGSTKRTRSVTRRALHQVAEILAFEQTRHFFLTSSGLGSELGSIHEQARSCASRSARLTVLSFGSP